jgi:hypothetical protein
MAERQALGNGPIEFMTRGGEFVQVPLRYLKFDDGGSLTVDNTWPAYAEHADELQPLLARLKDQRALVPEPLPPAGPAMVITAIDTGSQTNTITVTFGKAGPIPNDPAKRVFEATVKETNAYAGLTTATIKDVLGHDPDTGTKRGLAFVSSDQVNQPKNGEYRLTGKDNNDDQAPYTVVIPQEDGNPAFTLQSKADTREALNTKITISDATADGFTLTAVWSKTVEGVAPDQLNAQFGYVIKVEPPPKSESIGLPAPGTVVLGGGSDAEPPKPASATVVSSG